MLQRLLPLCLALLLTGCASLITGGPLVRPGEPTGTLVVVNGSASTIVDVVLISDCNASSYGLNRLPSGTRIYPGQSFKFRLSAGCWDVNVGSTYGHQEAAQRLSIRPNAVMQYTVE